MRSLGNRFFLSALFAATLFNPVSALADVAWNGPGYYINFYFAAEAGPFDNQSDCESVRQANPDWHEGSFCDYYATQADFDNYILG